MVYFIEALETNQCKIGYTASPAVGTRLKQLQTGCAQTLKVVGTLPLGTRDTEKRLHKRFDHLRIQREWFKLGIDLEKYLINQVQDGSDPIVEYIKMKALRKYWNVDRELSPAEVGHKHFNEFIYEALAAYKRFEVDSV